MSTPKHSSLPWVAKGQLIGQPHPEGQEPNAVYSEVAHVYARDGENADEFGDESYANRDFIVRACNAHYDLLAACEDLANWARRRSPSDDWPSECERAWKAIAKAKGGTR